MVNKRSEADHAPDPAPPTEAQTRASDLSSQDPQAMHRDADEAERALRREAQIRQAAYEAYLRRGVTGGGGELDDWLDAERNVDAKAPGAT